MPLDSRSARGKPLIEARDLKKRFGGVHAVDGMSITLAPGEMVGLIGPNGAGKTTLFNLLAGSLRPTSGEIRIGSVDVSNRGTGASNHTRRRQNVPNPAPLCRDDRA